MGKIKLSKAKVIHIYLRRLGGETETQLVNKYKVTVGHVRKVLMGMQDIQPPSTRWGWVWKENKERILNEHRRREGL